MAVRSRPLVNAEGLSGTADVLLYTVPAGRTALVKTVTFLNLTGAVATLILKVSALGGTVQVIRTPVANNEAVQFSELDVALGPGDQLLSDSSVGTGTYQVHVSGALLLGAPG